MLKLNLKVMFIALNLEEITVIPSVNETKKDFNKIFIDDRD